MERILKHNLKIVVGCMIVLLCMTAIKYGASKETVIAAGCLIAGCILNLINYYLKIDYEKRAIGMLGITFICIWAYSISVGGSSTAAVSAYVLLAMATSYFNSKLVLKFIIPVDIIQMVLAIIMPAAIEGSDGPTILAASEKVILFWIASIVIYLATKRGESMYKESMIMVEEISHNEDMTMKVANSLNDSLEHTAGEVHTMAKQADSVQVSTVQMQKAVASMTNAVVTMNDKIGDAVIAINNNYELANKLDQSFNDVTLAVKEGNTGATNMKVSLDEMGNTIGSAQQATEILLQDMSKITGILDEINSIASQTNLLSLNASIEAARAGEHGKGFAVVADEIRALSEESAKSASNIRTIVTTLTNTVKSVSNRITAGVESAKTGVNKMNTLVKLLENIEQNANAAEVIVQQEYQIINGIKKNFDLVTSEIETLVATSQENDAMITSISENITVQNEAINKFTNELENIENMAMQLVGETE
ncbi:methyl-accepting chemotaxis protein [Anaerosporobacter sp.]